MLRESKSFVIEVCDADNLCKLIASGEILVEAIAAVPCAIGDCWKVTVSPLELVSPDEYLGEPEHDGNGYAEAEAAPEYSVGDDCNAAVLGACKAAVAANSTASPVIDSFVDEAGRFNFPAYVAELLFDLQMARRAADLAIAAPRAPISSSGTTLVSDCIDYLTGVAPNCAWAPDERAQLNREPLTLQSAVAAVQRHLFADAHDYAEYVNQLAYDACQAIGIDRLEQAANAARAYLDESHSGCCTAEVVESWPVLFQTVATLIKPEPELEIAYRAGDKVQHVQHESGRVWTVTAPALASQAVEVKAIFAGQTLHRRFSPDLLRAVPLAHEAVLSDRAACEHGNLPEECEACMIASDQAFDASRESGGNVRGRD